NTRVALLAALRNGPLIRRSGGDKGSGQGPVETPALFFVTFSRGDLAAPALPLLTPCQQQATLPPIKIREAAHGFLIFRSGRRVPHEGAGFLRERVSARDRGED